VLEGQDHHVKVAAAAGAAVARAKRCYKEDAIQITEVTLLSDTVKAELCLDRKVTRAHNTVGVWTKESNVVPAKVLLRPKEVQLR